MKTAIFLGAGASASEGAPTQNTLFRDYFIKIQGYHQQGDMERELATFFLSMFHIDVDNSDLMSISFPTFEEALGILDLAERRKETFKDFDLENIAVNSNRIRFIRQYLIMLMAKIIDEKLLASKGIHATLVDNLKSSNLLKDTVFVSTNYDILIDNALTALYPDIMLDYGVDFTNFNEPNGWIKPDDNATRLYKIHGSLNWLYCPTCNHLTLTPKEKGVIRLLTNPRDALCPDCESLIIPIIVPPTYFKDMSNVFLSTIWNKAEHALRNVDHIIFCGYSFPDADIHIKYLIKRIQTNRVRRNLKISVFNYHKGKKTAIINEEKERYSRFLGPIKYQKKSFEEFANNPTKYFR